MTHVWARASWAYGGLVAVTLGYFLLRIPIQVTDSFTNVLALDRPLWELMTEVGIQPGYLRPGLWAALKAVYDASGGDYFTWYRWTQVLQLAAVIALFIALVRPRTLMGAAALPLGLAVLVGGHTFAGTLREAFPINTFLTVVVLCMASAVVALGERRWWSGPLLVVLFAAAALTVESGLLVGVIVLGAFALRARGASPEAAGIVAALMAGYFFLRFVVLAVGLPVLADRDAGFGFARYNGAELTSMFGGNPIPFYAYNVLSSGVGVLIAEPRDGVWRFTQSATGGGADVVLAIGVVASGLATLVLGRFVWRRRTAWRARDLDRDDQIVGLALLVLAANAALAYAYTKDVIMSPAGALFAAAVFVAIRDLLQRLPSMTHAGKAVALTALLLLSGSWAIRQVGIHAGLARTSFQVREQWAYIDDWLTAWRYDEQTPRVKGLSQQLQEDAVVRHPAKMPIREEWTRLFEVE